MPTKIPIWDQRMLLLMRHCIDTQVCDSKKDFLESIGLNPTNLKNIVNGIRSFTIEHIVAATKKYNISANWILGLDNEMKLRKPASTITMLKDAVRSLEAEITVNKIVNNGTSRVTKKTTLKK